MAGTDYDNFVIVCYRHAMLRCVIVMCSYTYVVHCLFIVAYRFHNWWCDCCRDYYSSYSACNGGSYLHV